MEKIKNNYHNNVLELEKWFNDFVKNEIHYYKLDNVIIDKTISISDEFEDTKIVDLVFEENLPTQFDEDDIQELIIEKKSEINEHVNEKVYDKHVIIYMIAVIILFITINFFIK